MYQAEVSRNSPSCFLFIIDQSTSMLEVLNPTDMEPFETPKTLDGRTYTHSAQGSTKAEQVADAINRLLQNLVIRCTRNNAVRDYYHVGVLGYGATVGSAFTGALAGKDLVPISENC